MGEKYYVVIRYNNDDTYDAETIGIYSTKNKAKKKIMLLIEEEFDNLDERDIRELMEEWFPEWDDEELPTWEDFEEVMKYQLRSHECKGLSYLNYKIGTHEIDEL